MEIFNLIKNKKYEKLIIYLKKNPNIDLNKKDELNVNFIEFVIKSGNLELLNEVLKHNVYLDILDNNGTLIIYELIKFNSLEILKKILDYDKERIGISILEKRDILGRTLFHYIVIFNNLKALDIILSYQANPFIFDKVGNNIYFYCIKYNRSIALKKVLERFGSPNVINKDGMTLLQTAIQYSNFEIINYLLDNYNINLNNKSFEYGLTALHQFTLLNDKNNLKRIIGLGASINLSDNLGNNVLHFSLLDYNYNLFIYFLKFDLINLNHSNLNGDTPLHIFLENILLGKKIKKDINIIRHLVEETDLNIQNHEGNTCLHLLVQTEFLSELRDILEKKELNIFIENYRGINVLNLVKQNQYFIEIVKKAFFNILKKSKLTIEWEKNCRDVAVKNISKNNYNKTKCLEKIESIIYKNGRSIPKIKEINFDFESGVYLNDCFFSGFPIDLLFGLLWLKNNVNNVNLVLEFSLISFPKLEEFYKKMGIDFSYYLDFSNIMVYWSFQKIFFPDYFTSRINKILENNRKGFIIFPIGIETSQGSHANIIIWNIETKNVERFEPNGANHPIGLDYNQDLLDKLLYDKLITIKPDIKYIIPKNYSPHVGFIMIESLEENKCKQIGDPTGFCAAWCFWYAYHKTLNPFIDSDVLINSLINKLKIRGKSFKNVVRNFSRNISNLRDDYLERININIHDWKLSNYSKDKLEKLEKEIFKHLI